jgi:hypothetical protein
MTITTNDESICVELHGKEQFWALRAKISIPKETITDIQFAPEFSDWNKWEVRMPGTHSPGRLIAGSYWTEEGWDFLYIKKPIGFSKPKVENVIVIQTSQDRYKRVIITSDKKAVSGIIKWWKKNPTNTDRPKKAKKSSRPIKPIHK